MNSCLSIDPVKPGEMLATRNLSYSLVIDHAAFPILNNITVSLSVGKITALLGPNGCGKTTLLRILAGLLPPSSGRVLKSQSCASIGLVFQDVSANLLPWRTVLDNIALPGLLKAEDPVAARGRAESILNRMELSWASERLPSELSGGQRQLVSLSRWLANPPNLLLIDEGWAMLDLMQRQRIYGLLRELADSSVAIGIVTHSMSDLASLVDSVFIFSARPASIHSYITFRPDQTFKQRNDQLWATIQEVFGTT